MFNVTSDEVIKLKTFCTFDELYIIIMISQDDIVIIVTMFEAIEQNSVCGTNVLSKMLMFIFNYTVNQIVNIS